MNQMQSGFGRQIEPSEAQGPDEHSVPRENTNVDSQAQEGRISVTPDVEVTPGAAVEVPAVPAGQDMQAQASPHPHHGASSAPSEAPPADTEDDPGQAGSPLTPPASGAQDGTVREEVDNTGQAQEGRMAVGAEVVVEAGASDAAVEVTASPAVQDDQAREVTQAGLSDEVPEKPHDTTYTEDQTARPPVTPVPLDDPSAKEPISQDPTADALGDTNAAPPDEAAKPEEIMASKDARPDTAASPTKGSPEPENTSCSPPVQSGQGTKSHPYILRPGKLTQFGGSVMTEELITVTKLDPGAKVHIRDNNSDQNGGRFSMDPITAEGSDGPGSGSVSFRLKFDDGLSSENVNGKFDGRIQVGLNSVHFAWSVTISADDTQDPTIGHGAVPDAVVDVADKADEPQVPEPADDPWGNFEMGGPGDSIDMDEGDADTKALLWAREQAAILAAGGTVATPTLGSGPGQFATQAELDAAMAALGKVRHAHEAEVQAKTDQQAKTDDDDMQTAEAVDVEPAAAEPPSAPSGEEAAEEASASPPVKTSAPAAATLSGALGSVASCQPPACEVKSGWDRLQEAGSTAATQQLGGVRRLLEPISGPLGEQQLHGAWPL